MSEMTAKEYLETKKRMCDTYGMSTCHNCPLIEVKGDGCDITDYPDEAIAIVQKWGEEHQVKTLTDEFLRFF